MGVSKLERLFGDKYVNDNIEKAYFAAFGIICTSCLADLFSHWHYETPVGQYAMPLTMVGAFFALGANIVGIVGNEIYNHYLSAYQSQPVPK